MKSNIDYYGETDNYIHLKFGDCRKAYNFTKKFIKEHSDFAKQYQNYFENGARYRSCGDGGGSSEEKIAGLQKTMWIIQKADPKWWVLENPVGRINSLFPEMEFYGPSYFQPWQYGDPYTKKTGLWGKFKMPPVRNPVRPIMYTNSKGQKGSWMWAKLGGNSEKTKELRSLTPAGFAQAFFEANP